MAVGGKGASWGSRGGKLAGTTTIWQQNRGERQQCCRERRGRNEVSVYLVDVCFDSIHLADI